MNSRTTDQFRKALSRLPDQVQNQARLAYRQFQHDPGHPSLRFKPVHTSLPIYAARISKGYRALGQKDERGMVWFWVGPHADYDRLLSQL
ncbi:MAG: hypothetical protein ACOYMW_04385 [Candidatus Competibacteraceae bacterium]